MAKYWFADIPGVEITTAQAEKLQVVAGEIGTTAVAAVLGALVTTDSSYVLDITNAKNVSTSARCLVTTALASAEGVVVNLADNTGYIAVKTKTSTGGALKRYILLFSS